MSFPKHIDSISIDAGPYNGVGSESDCRSRGREYDPGLVPYFRGDYELISSVILLLPLIQEGLLSVPSEIMCTMYLLTIESSLPWISVAR